MTFEMLIPVISMHHRTAGLGSLFSEMSLTGFNPTDLYSLNDALYNQISLVTPTALRNSGELFALKIQSLIIHRLTNGNLMVLMDGNGGYWSQRYCPRPSDLTNALGPLHDIADKSLLAGLFNMGICTTDTPSGLPIPVDIDAVRQEVDLTVVGFHTYMHTRPSRIAADERHYLQIDSVINIRQNLYQFMTTRDFIWMEVDQNFNPVKTCERKEGNVDTSALVNHITIKGYDDTVTIQPGLE